MRDAPQPLKFSLNLLIKIKGLNGQNFTLTPLSCLIALIWNIVDIARYSQKKRIQRTAAGMRTTGGLARLRRLSPVRLRSDHPRRGLLNELFFRPDKVIFLETVPFSSATIVTLYSFVSL